MIDHEITLDKYLGDLCKAGRLIDAFLPLQDKYNTLRREYRIALIHPNVARRTISVVEAEREKAALALVEPKYFYDRYVQDPVNFWFRGTTPKMGPVGTRFIPDEDERSDLWEYRCGNLNSNFSRLMDRKNNGWCKSDKCLIDSELNNITQLDYEGQEWYNEGLAPELITGTLGERKRVLDWLINDASRYDYRLFLVDLLDNQSDWESIIKQHFSRIGLMLWPDGLSIKEPSPIVLNATPAPVRVPTISEQKIKNRMLVVLLNYCELTGEIKLPTKKSIIAFGERHGLSGSTFYEYKCGRRYGVSTLNMLSSLEILKLRSLLVSYPKALKLLDNELVKK